MDAQYIYPSHSIGTQWHDWLKATIGDMRAAAPATSTDKRRGLVLIGVATTFIKFLPVVLSAEALKREVLTVYSPDALKAACERSALVIVQTGVDVATLLRERSFFEECMDQALVIFLIPERLRPQSDAVFQHEIAQQAGLGSFYYVVLPKDLRNRVVAASHQPKSMAQQLKELRAIRF
jgi:hypothetical protein